MEGVEQKVSMTMYHDAIDRGNAVGLYWKNKYDQLQQDSIRTIGELIIASGGTILVPSKIVTVDWNRANVVQDQLISEDAIRWRVRFNS